MGQPAADLIIVGGGVAGLAAFAALAKGQRCLLLEREPMLATHASGKSAAIFRPLEADETTAALSARSRQGFAALMQDDPVRQSGLILASADDVELHNWQLRGQRQGLEAQLLAPAELRALCPMVTTGEALGGVLLPGGGVIDTHALMQALAAAGRAAGGEIRTGQGVRSLWRQGARVCGVELDDGTRLPAQQVVLAAGAWGRQLGESAGLGLPLAPARRHLVQLQLPASVALSSAAPVLWRLDDELYLRPESGGVLASPCDQQLFEPCDPPVDARALETLADKLARTAPALAAAQVRSRWACLRTFAPDAELVVGPDPRVTGLCWFAGLGGRGMAVSVGAAEVLAQRLAGSNSKLGAALDPARLALD
ncbi:MAG: FAD-binding oxidoreductase [Myxococcales bacterium]|nr:FAD-binding oxidoreductase [Myxococcales bacterium]